MADVLRQLLDSGKLSDEECHLILRGLGKQIDELNLSKKKQDEEEEAFELNLSKNEQDEEVVEEEDEEEEEEDFEVHFIKHEEGFDVYFSKKKEEEEEEKVDGWTSEEEEAPDEEYCRQVDESLGFDIDGNVRIPASGLSPVFLGDDRKPRSEVSLYGRLGVHCFNFEQGRKLQYVRIPKYNIQLPYAMSYHITVEVKDLADDDDSPHTFQTLATRFFSKYGEDLRVSTVFCRIKPDTPVAEEHISLLDNHAVDKFYKGCMPNFVSEAGADDDDDKLRFYEVQEQDICDNDWLCLYTEFALFCFWRYNEDGFESCLPVEIKKIVVETCETHTEPRLKLKSSNAIFHINFSAKSRHYKSVVRRTMDGISGHMVLEVNSWVNDQPSSA
ncbi:PREDICTED: UPF0725 protein At3g44770-like [Camelina sativa]|uniref:UPF0725 protein At3g44770-like n=1 Tax=Camelina sativa TaxID=90675 RepID=A0ABM0YM79_CAMSA|nr:PREDICTED: UPF0725 protein At3g44770-like [Camelina sativa]